ncbi:MAG: ABC transporter substrate-binding protein [Bacilli bacterium]
MKKNILVHLGALFVLSLTSCTHLFGNFNQSNVNKTKTQLTISCWDGGHGIAWLEEIAQQFEALNEETEFESGKKGIQIWVTPSKGNVYDAFATTFTSQDAEIAISEQCNYNGFVAKKTALDITDVVTQPLTEYGETRSIADKLSSSNRAFYGCETDTFYGLPWYESLMGFQYDIDLFDEYGYYFAHGTSEIADFISPGNPVKSTGPDGILGNEDDGLPRTYDEFFKLCDRMVEDGTIPFIYAGNAQVYINNLLSSLAADYEGYQQMALNFTLDGTATNIIKTIVGNTVTLEAPTVINNANGYLLKKQAGYYYGLKFIERLLTTPNASGGYKYYDKSFCRSEIRSQKDAQTEFLRSRFKGSGSSPIAMLIDGSWWHAEAKATFDYMQNTPGATALERHIGFMPMPKADISRLGKATYFNCWMTSINVRANIEPSKIPVAKQFLRYMHTDKSLSTFTRVTSNVRPFNYEITAEDEPQTTFYAKEMLRLHNADSVSPTIVMPWSRNELILNNLSSFMINSTMYSSLVRGILNTIISISLIPNRSDIPAVTAEEYFWGLSTYMNQARWEENYSNYF